MAASAHSASHATWAPGTTPGPRALLTAHYPGCGCFRSTEAPVKPWRALRVRDRGQRRPSPLVCTQGCLLLPQAAHNGSRGGRGGAAAGARFAIAAPSGGEWARQRAAARWAAGATGNSAIAAAQLLFDSSGGTGGNQGVDNGGGGSGGGVAEGAAATASAAATAATALFQPGGCGC